MPTPTSLPSTFVAGNVLTAAQLNNLRGGFRILQVLSTTKTDTFSTTSQTYTNVTGLSVAITPQFTTSKILVLASINVGFSSGSNANANVRITGGNATAYVGDTAGNRTRSAAQMIRYTAGMEQANFPISLNYLDSPATTSAITYQIQMLTSTAGQTAWINRGDTDTDTAYFGRTASTITVLEVSA